MFSYKTKSFRLDELTPLTQSKAKELKESLNKICPLCGKMLDSSSPLDHQHMTSKETIGQNGAGLVRAVLCNNCNLYLGKIENNSKRFQIQNLTETLRRIADYLEQDNLPYIHPSETFRLKEKIGKMEYNKLIKILSLKLNKDPKLLTQKYKYPKNGFVNKTIEKLRLQCV